MHEKVWNAIKMFKVSYFVIKIKICFYEQKVTMID